MISKSLCCIEAMSIVTIHKYHLLQHSNETNEYNKIGSIVFSNWYSVSTSVSLTMWVQPTTPIYLRELHNDIIIPWGGDKNLSFCLPPHEARKGDYWIRHRLSVRPLTSKSVVILATGWLCLTHNYIIKAGDSRATLHWLLFPSTWISYLSLCLADITLSRHILPHCCRLERDSCRINCVHIS